MQSGFASETNVVLLLSTVQSTVYGWRAANIRNQVLHVTWEPSKLLGFLMPGVKRLDSHCEIVPPVQSNKAEDIQSRVNKDKSQIINFKIILFINNILIMCYNFNIVCIYIVSIIIFLYI